jgi:hypothetical protein
VCERGTKLWVGGIFGEVLLLGISPSSRDVPLELQSDTVVAIPSPCRSRSKPSLLEGGGRGVQADGVVLSPSPDPLVIAFSTISIFACSESTCPFIGCEHGESEEDGGCFEREHASDSCGSSLHIPLTGTGAPLTSVFSSPTEAPVPSTLSAPCPSMSIPFVWQFWASTLFAISSSSRCFFFLIAKSFSDSFTFGGDGGGGCGCRGGEGVRER